MITSMKFELRSIVTMCQPQIAAAKNYKEDEMTPLIQIVDENDKPLSGETIQVARDEGLWHRYIRIMVSNDEGDYLLQLRGPQNRIFPECWDYSAAGHVDAGEDYETAAKREIAEELGLETVELQEIEYFKSEDRFNEQYLNRFNKTFQIVVPKETQINLDPNEVLEAKWFTVAEIKEIVAASPGKVTPALVRFTDSV